MKINIIIQYRPFSSGGLNSPSGELYQNENGLWKIDSAEERLRYGFAENKWLTTGEVKCQRSGGRDDLATVMKYLNKNSHYKHNLIIATDGDVHLNENYIKTLGDNIKIVSSGYTTKDVPIGKNQSIYRINSANICGVNSIPDDEWLCYAYGSDFICCKDWDKLIVEAINVHGDKCCYVPIFTEIRGGYSDWIFKWSDIQTQNLWELPYRQSYFTVMPIPDCGYFTENDMDYYITKMNETRPSNKVETPGQRSWGYYAVLIMKAKYAKQALRMSGTYNEARDGCFDLDFDNRLNSVCGLKKVVVTNSFVFHPFCEFRE